KEKQPLSGLHARIQPAEQVRPRHAARVERRAAIFGRDKLRVHRPSTYYRAILGWWRGFLTQRRRDAEERREKREMWNSDRISVQILCETLRLRVSASKYER